MFQLKEKNKALAKQYYIVKEEKQQLEIENKRHCIQIRSLQSDCDSYQAVIQNIYSRVIGIIQKSLQQLVWFSTHLLNCRI